LGPPGGFRFVHALPVVGLALAAPILTWWALGDLSSSGAGPDADHLYGPYHVNPHAELVIGFIAIAAAVLSLVALGLRAIHKTSMPRTWTVVVLLCSAGVFAAFVWRSVTAGVDGANIGGGMLFFLAPAVLPALLGVAAANATEDMTSPALRGAIVTAAVLSAPALFAVLVVAL
jgi:hypothetical protein